MANKLQVKICGQEYTLVSDDSREYMLEMADYVDRKMVAVKNQNNRLSTSMAAILVALNVADDMKHAEAKAKEALN
ncbi:MAG: cell division protein ZapA, partial [Eubacteriales bacterium]